MLKLKLKRSLWNTVAGIVAAASVAACIKDVPAGPEGKTFTSALEVHTRVDGQEIHVLPDSSLQVSRAEPILVHCLVRRGSAWVDSIPWHVVTEPPMHTAQDSSVEVRLTAPASGSYHVRCVAGGSEGTQDEHGVTLQVVEPTLGPDPGTPELWDAGPGPVPPAPGPGPSPRPPPTPADPAPGPPPREAPRPVAGQPYAWKAKWDDAGQDLCYAQQRKFLLLQGGVYDALGAAVEKLAVEVVADDPSVETFNDPPAVRFTKPGVFEVSAQLVGVQGPYLQPVRRSFMVDSTPPVIRIDAPDRGASLRGGMEQPLTVRGVIEDSSGLTSAAFNGVPLPIKPGSKRHEFAVELQPAWGMNVFTVEAMDRCEVPAKHSQSFLRSDTFAQAVDEPTTAVRARFGEAMLNGGESGAPSSVTGLVNRALQSASFRDLFPENLSASPAGPDGRLAEVRDRCGLYSKTSRATGYEVLRRGDFGYDRVELSTLRPLSGKWQAEVTFYQLRLPARINWYLHVPCIAAVPGWMDADILADKFTMQFEIEVDATGPHLRVPADSFRAYFDSRSPRIDYKNKDMALSALPGGLLTHVKNGLFRASYVNLFEQSPQRPAARGDQHGARRFCGRPAFGSAFAVAADFGRLGAREHRGRPPGGRQSQWRRLRRAWPQGSHSHARRLVGQARADGRWAHPSAA